MCSELRTTGQRSRAHAAERQGRPGSVASPSTTRAASRLRGLALGQVAQSGRALCESIWPTPCPARVSGERSAGEGRHPRRLHRLPPRDPGISDKEGRVHRPWIRLLFVPGERRHRSASRHRDIRPGPSRARPALTTAYPPKRASRHRTLRSFQAASMSSSAWPPCTETGFLTRTSSEMRVIRVEKERITAQELDG